MFTFKEAKAYARRGAMKTGVAAVVEVAENSFKAISNLANINTILNSDRDAVKLLVKATVTEKDENAFYYSYDYSIQEYNIDTSTAELDISGLEVDILLNQK